MTRPTPRSTRSRSLARRRGALTLGLATGLVAASLLPQAGPAFATAPDAQWNLTTSGTAATSAYGVDNAYTVPGGTGTCALLWEVAGGAGGNGISGGTGGVGLKLITITPVAPGDQFTVLAGRRGADGVASTSVSGGSAGDPASGRGRGGGGGSGGGGGGGASSVWSGNPIAGNGTLRIMAPGGGGAGSSPSGGDAEQSGPGTGGYVGGLHGVQTGALYGQNGSGGGGGGGHWGGSSGGGSGATTAAGGGGGDRYVHTTAYVWSVQPNTGDGYVKAYSITCPGAPASVTYSSTTTTSTQVTFTPAVGASEPSTGWEYNVDGGSWNPLATTSAGGAALQGTVSGLSTGATATVGIRATTQYPNVTGVVSTSSVTAAALTPGAPTSVVAVAGDGQVGLSWAAPLSTGTSALTGYQVTATPSSGPALPPVVLSGTATSTTVTGLTNGTAYTFTVKAANGSGLGAASAASAAVTPAVPAPPAPPSTAAPLRPVVPPPPGTHRYAGADRVGTSTAVSQQLFPRAGSAPRVVLTTSATFADALSGARLASASSAPLLMTRGDALDGGVRAEVERVLAVGGQVEVLGGEQALSPAVAEALKTATSPSQVRRTAGADRYATAVEVAGRVQATTAAAARVAGAAPGVLAATTTTGTQPIYLVSGADHPDGLVVAALAARTGGTVVLTDGPRMPDATRAYLEANDPAGARTVPVGGPAAAAAATLEGPASRAAAEAAVVGVDRYDTAREVAARFTATGGSTSGTVGLASGQDWPDALVGATAMGNLGGPLLLTVPSELSPAAARALDDLSAGGRPTTGLVFGGSDAVSSTASDAFAARIRS